MLTKGECITDLNKNGNSLSANPDKSVKNPVQRTSMVLQREEDIEQFKELLLDGYYCEVEELLIQCTDSLLLSKGLHTLCNVCLPHMRVINVKGCDFDYQLLNELFMYYNFPNLSVIHEIQSIDSSVNEQPSVEKPAKIIIPKPSEMMINGLRYSIKPSPIQNGYSISILKKPGNRGILYDSSENGTSVHLSSGGGGGCRMVLDYSMKYEQLIPIVIRVYTLSHVLLIELCSLRYLF